MKSRNDRLEQAVIISILLHLILIGLLLLGSLFTKMIEPAAGGSGGDSESFEAVMVDTGQVAAEYGRIKENKQGSRPKVELKEEVVEDSKPTPEEVVEENRKEQALALQKQEEIKKQQEQKLQEEQKRQQELAKQEQQRKLQEEEATRKKAAEAARIKAEAEAKRLEAAAKQAEEDKKAKEVEKQKLLEEQKKAEKEAKEKAEKEAKVKAEKEAKEKAEKEAKAKAEKDAKEKAEKEAKAKAEKEAKEKAEKDAKAKAEKEAKADAAAKAKNNKALDDFLNSGDIGGGTSKGGNKNNTGSQGSGGTSGLGQGANVDGSAYGQRIKKLIESRYRVDPSFAGKQCDVKIFLERDGTIRNYQVVGGDKAVCDAAVSAIVATRKVPPAPSEQVYQQYKSPTLDFSLKVK